MNFGDAIAIIKTGGMVSRQKWNGKIEIELTKGGIDFGYFVDNPEKNKAFTLNVESTTINGLSSSLFDTKPGLFEFIQNPVLVYLDLKHNVQGIFTPSHEDLLSEDWYEIPVEDDDDDICEDCPIKDQCPEYNKGKDDPNDMFPGHSLN